MTIFVENLIVSAVMPRLRIHILLAFAILIGALSWSANAKTENHKSTTPTVIYNNVSGKMPPEGADEMTINRYAQLCIGETTIEDAGNNEYHIVSTGSGGYEFVNIMVGQPEVVNDDLITFETYSKSRGHLTVRMTPKRLFVADDMIFAMIELPGDNKFAKLVKYLRSKSSEAPKKPTPDVEILRVFDAPLGISGLSDTDKLTLGDLRREIQHAGGNNVEEGYSVGRSTFRIRDGVTLLGKPVDVMIGLNRKELDATYEARFNTLAEAEEFWDLLKAIFEDCNIRFTDDPKPMAQFARWTSGKYNDRRISISIYKGDRYYSVNTVVRAPRTYNESDRIHSISPSLSPGGNLFDVTGLSIDRPFAEIVRGYKDLLFPGEVSDYSISAGRDGLKLIMPMTAAGSDCRGLTSQRIEADRRDNLTTYVVEMSVDSDRAVLYDRAPAEACYDEIIRRISANGLKPRKATEKELKTLGVNRNDYAGAKRIMAVDRGNYTDYYILASNIGWHIILLAVHKDN